MSSLHYSLRLHEIKKQNTLLQSAMYRLSYRAHRPQPSTLLHQLSQGQLPRQPIKKSAHLGYIPLPAHPDHLAGSCGVCHAEIVEKIAGTAILLLPTVPIFSEKRSVPENKLTSFLQTPQKSDPETVLELADDLLRRRCFRCHLYSSGDNYPAVVHGTGCAACHMAFIDGKPASHSWQKPGDEQCLSCHYGNYVGFDYYGRFEHDLNVEYRTPYTTTEKHFRPYGVEYHQLTTRYPSIRGMLCIDCHSGRELMEPAGEKPSCKKCHHTRRTATLFTCPGCCSTGSFCSPGTQRQGPHHPRHAASRPQGTKRKNQLSGMSCPMDI